MGNTVIQLRNDTAANWTSNDPTLALGEVGLETDTNKMKLGDGTTAWSSLSYFSAVPSFSGVKCKISAVQSISSGSWTAISWTGEDFDTNNFHSTTTNPSRITIPAGISKVILYAGYNWSVNTVGLRSHGIFKNGSFIVTELHALTGGYNAGSITTGPVSVTEGDYFEFQVLQNSGSTITFGENTSALSGVYFSMQVLE
jgi:hypothetical protein